MTATCRVIHIVTFTGCDAHCNNSPEESPLTPQHDTVFVSTMIESGTSPAVAAELERRIEIVESAEGTDTSRLPLSAKELTVYIGTTVAACLIGLLVVAL